MADFTAALQRLLPYCDEGLKCDSAETLLCFDAPESGWILYVPRLLFYLEGTVMLRYGTPEGTREVEYTAPIIIYCSQRALLASYANTLDSPSRALSFSYYPGYIRAMHIDFDGVNHPPTDRDVFYHTAQPLPDAGMKLIETMDALHEAGQGRLVAPLARTLFEYTVAVLRASDPAPIKPTHRVWEEINTYLRNHREANISRAQLAGIFQLSPGYISRLAKQYTQTELSEIQLKNRLEHAAGLLLNTRLNVDEIAFRCGFKYPSYFIRRFKARYGATPHFYRNHPPEASSDE